MSAHPHRIEMTVALSSQLRTLVPGARRPRPDDLPALAILMWAAYQGTVDYTGESVDDATQEIAKTFAGGFGMYLAQYSYAAEGESTLASAVLVTRRNDQPLLAFVMTAPRWKRKCLAKATIVNVMQDLFEVGETELQLALYTKNQPALDLYRCLGFKELRRAN